MATRRSAPAPAAAPARSRAGTRPSAPAEANTVKSSYRGAAGRRQMEEEQVKAEARSEARKASFGAPFRYFTPIGETREIVIVDEAPDFFRHEHALKNKATGRFDNFTPCIDEHANCPVCAIAERPAYFAMYLTIIDLSGYEGKDGYVEFSKKLLVAKPTQQKKIMRLYDRHKSLRGMILSMTRDTDKDAAIGNDIEFVEFMDEDELLQFETDYTDKEGKVHPIIAHEVYDYDALFPEMTEKQLIAIAGGRPQQGSREANRKALGDDWEDPAPRTATRRGATPQDDGEDDDVPAPAPRRGARAPAEDAPAPRRGARPAADAPAPRRARPAPAEDADDDQQEEAAPVSRRAGRARPEPEPVDDDTNPDTGAPWADDDDPAEAPPPRRAAPRAAAPAPRGRAAADDDAPQRAPASVAARRAALRR